jgi:two-component system, chemotaxis family, protein-glutamate methylesterase/glutaminase
MTSRHLVVIGGSAGGIKALTDLLAELPPKLPAAVAVVLHRPAQGSGALQTVMARCSRLPVVTPVDGEEVRSGHVYLGPPDRHLLVHDDRLRLVRGAKVNRVRPAVDPLFRSAARWFGPAATGVVLSGALDDGASGLAAIAGQGGTALVQDPDEAMFPGMPLAALAAVPAAKALPAVDLATAVAERVEQPPPATAPPLDEALVAETDLAERDEPAGVDQPGITVAIACPECRGAMKRVDLAGAVHFRCHVGHAYSPQSLLATQGDTAESALWTAVSVLEEQAAVHTTLAERTRDAERSGHHRRAAARAAAATDAIRRTIDTAKEASAGV